MVPLIIWKENPIVCVNHSPVHSVRDYNGQLLNLHSRFCSFHLYKSYGIWIDLLAVASLSIELLTSRAFYSDSNQLEETKQWRWTHRRSTHTNKNREIRVKKQTNTIFNEIRQFVYVLGARERGILLILSRPASQNTRKRSRDEGRRRIYTRKIPHTYKLSLKVT